MVLPVDDTWGVVLLRAGLIDSFPLKLPIFKPSESLYPFFFLHLSASPKWKTCGRSCHLLTYERKSETGQGRAHQEHSFRMMNVAKYTFVRKTCSLDQHH